jgi:DNA polymerase-4
VVPRALPATASVRHRFDEHTLDGAAVRAALLELVVRLGTRLRGRGQAARALTLTLKFAGGSSWEKTRRLTAPSAHEDDVRRLAYQLMDAAGLQRGRLTGLTLKGEGLFADAASWSAWRWNPAWPAPSLPRPVAVGLRVAPTGG